MTVPTAELSAGSRGSRLAGQQAAGSKKVRRVNSPRWFVGLAFMAPALIVYAIYVIYPAYQSISYSFFDWAGPGKIATPVGFGNYIELFSDPIFYQAMGNTAIVIIVSLAVQLPLGLVLALILSGRIRGRRIWRAIYFLPTLMSTVGVALLWGFIYNPNYGAVNDALQAIGLGNLAQGWLGQTSTALASVLVTTVWQFAPFYMIIYAAAIASLPAEIYEAASIDGANKRQQFFRITLPLLRPTLVTTAVLSLIGSIKYFDLIYVMTNGGPDNATQLLATYVFQLAFTDLRFGYASAVAVMMLIFALILTAIVLWRSRSADRKPLRGV
jgi:raffinose/stachyose/melibiose transport system permease protein